MATIVEVTAVGDAAGIILPREIMDKLHVQKGDKLYLTEVEGSVQLSPHAPDFQAKIAVGERVMQENWSVLRKLAE
jgi:putative addiction module antidote